MSLSGQYLETLSQRYRKQMEQMQKAFNTTTAALLNTSRKAEERASPALTVLHVLVLKIF